VRPALLRNLRNLKLRLIEFAEFADFWQRTHRRFCCSSHMPGKELQLVLEAAARNVSAVLSLPSAGMLRNHKSRFIAEAEDGVLLETPADNDALIAELIRTQSLCAVSFRSGSHKVMFAARIRRREKEWQLNQTTIIDAIVVEVPVEIKTMQRRANYRVEVRLEDGICARVWRLGPTECYKAEPCATKEVNAELRNISVGGIGVKLIGKDGALPIISQEDRLRVELNTTEQIIVVEGKMRAPTIPPTGGVIITGIQFMKLEDDIEGRQTLAQLVRLVGELQREELRTMRAGLLGVAS
jgi:c-di-GMP-binding flagellar brake protein YcgR